MKPTLRQLLFRSVSDANILPLTSVCNVKCVFCSNPQNPSGVENFRMPHLDMETFYQLLDFINPKERITIGESVTRINEGEPLTHPHFPRIINEIRKRFPDTPIHITTNGIKLSERLAGIMAAAGGITLNISLNSCRPLSRQLLFGVSEDREVKERLKIAGRFGIPFNGSIVAVPHLTGWDDLQESIFFLEEQGALFTRVFLPGYTREAEGKAKFESFLWEEVHNFISKLRKQVNMPVSCEPPNIRDLAAVVEGIFPGSPADMAGIKPGDIIISVAGKEVFSRVDAFNRLKDAGGQVPLTVAGGKGPMTIFLHKESGENPGILMSYDVDPDLIDQLASLAQLKNYRRILLLVSELGEEAITMALHKAKPDTEFIISRVTNDFFGGTIKSAGLLVIEDFVKVLKEKGDLRSRYDAVFIPQIAFDPWGRDLRGNHYLDLNQILSVPLEVI